MAHYISIMQSYGRDAIDPVRADIDEVITMLWQDPRYLGAAKGEGRLMAMGYNSTHERLNGRREELFDSLDCIMIDCDGVQDEDGNIDANAIGNFRRFANGYRYVLWQTATSTTEAPKFRVILPMTRTVRWTKFTKKAIARLFAKWTDPKASWHEEPLTPKIETLIVQAGKEFPAEALERAQKALEDEEKLNSEIARQLDAMTSYRQMTRLDWRKKDMSQNEKVRHYLDTPYTKKCGNGDSDASLYRAICVCLTADDEDTLNEVLNKARAEKWSRTELDRKIAQARRFVRK